MTIGRMLAMDRLDFLLQPLILGGHLQLTINVLAIDLQSFRIDLFVAGMADYFDFF